MNIQPTDNNISMQGWSWFKNLKNRAKQAALDAAPTHTSKESVNKRKWESEITNKISNPAINRGIMGATALLTQPVIDAYNHRVDNETRAVSVCRTTAKILAGTLVGCIVRDITYRLTEKLTDVNGNKKYSKWLLPKDYLSEIAKNKDFLNNHRSVISMSAALFVMMFTNFLIDAPLTNKLTNFFNGLREKNSKENIKAESEVKYA